MQQRDRGGPRNFERMIEGEAVLDSAQETGYRLCVAPADQNQDSEGGEWSKIFSAQWDPCQESRLYVCSQRGQLRAYNVEDGTYRTYRVLFRNHSTDLKDLMEEGRPIAYHWDKMVAIPERPDEIVFLLGVSKNLMYSALPGTVPYPEEPFISNTTRSDFTGYIYGTPVMELWTHVARITSIAVNTTGQVLASGDEQGNLKLLMLRLLDQLIITQKGAKDSQKKGNNTQLPTFSNFLPEYKVTMRAHSHGPIFSMQWLPMPTLPPKGSDEDAFNISRRTRYYSLATGSLDCAVRIWGVTCSVSKGLTVSPVMVLDTLNTQTLCLHSFLSMSKPTVSEGIVRKQLQRLRLSDKKTANLGPLEIPDPSSIYLSAGTSTGSIYIWRLDTKHLFHTIVGLDPSLAPGSGLASFTPVRLIDDGTRLHSLLQSSDRPVVSVTLSTCRNAALGANAPKKVCLIAVDSASSVRTHRESDVQAEFEGVDDGSSSASSGLSGTGSRRSPKRRSGSVAASIASGAAELALDKPPASSVAKYPVVLCGEAHFPSKVVVGASFQERPPLTDLADASKAPAAQDTWTLPETAGKFTRNSRLLLGTSDGQLQIVDAANVFFPSRPVEVESTNVAQLLARLGHSAAASSSSSSSSSSTGAGGADGGGELASASSSSGGGGIAGGGGATFEAHKAAGAGPGPVIQNKAPAPAPAPVSASAPAPVAARAPAPVQAQQQVVQEEQEEEEEKERGWQYDSAPAPPTSSSSASASASRPPQPPVPRSHAPQPQQRPQATSSAAAPAAAAAPVKSALVQATPRPSSSSSASERPTRRVVLDAPTETPSQEQSAGVASRAGSAAAPAASAAATAASKARPRSASPSPNPAPAPSSSSAPASALRARASPVNAGPSKSVSAAISAALDSADASLAAPCSYASPAVNSSVAVQEQLAALSRRLDQLDSDELSVGSMSTTTSARLSAAGLVNVPVDAPRYKSALTPVLGAFPSPPYLSLSLSVYACQPSFTL